MERNVDHQELALPELAPQDAIALMLENAAYDRGVVDDCLDFLFSKPDFGVEVPPSIVEPLLALRKSYAALLFEAGKVEPRYLFSSKERSLLNNIFMPQQIDGPVRPLALAVSINAENGGEDQWDVRMRLGGSLTKFAIRSGAYKLPDPSEAEALEAEVLTQEADVTADDVPGTLEVQESQEVKIWGKQAIYKVQLLYLRTGKSPVEIAEELGVSVSDVNKALNKL